MNTDTAAQWLKALLPPTCPVQLDAVTVEPETLQLQLTTTAPSACCPLCAVPSTRVHSRYQRPLTDLPWGHLSVHIRLTVRKFVCRHATCVRRIFTARLPARVAVYARRTGRLVGALQAIGVALGGHAGARLAARLRLPTSPATLLGLVRTAPVLATPAPQAIGVDEWAWRRGHRYGTILVDLMTHRVVDLLPDRSAASVAAWLAQHPTITVIGRDRSDLYAEGIRRGAPYAVQVVDRFHLVHNLRQVLAAVRLDRRSALQAAAVGTTVARTPAESLVPGTPMYRGRRRSPKPAPREEAAPPPRHARWVAVYAAVHALQAQGTSVTVIARRLGISRPTVDAYLRREPPPGPKQPQWRPSARVLTPFVPYLIRRWRESGADSMPLGHEIQAWGSSHSARTVCRFITQLRRAAEAGQPLEPQGSPFSRPQGPSARAVSFAMVCPAAKRSKAVQTYRDPLGHVDTHIARA
jgi:transposase